MLIKLKHGYSHFRYTEESLKRMIGEECPSLLNELIDVAQISVETLLDLILGCDAVPEKLKRIFAIRLVATARDGSMRQLVSLDKESLSAIKEIEEAIVLGNEDSDDYWMQFVALISKELSLIVKPYVDAADFSARLLMVLTARARFTVSGATKRADMLQSGVSARVKLVAAQIWQDILAPKVISTVEELWEAQPSEFKEHVWENDGDLPTTSLAALMYEYEHGRIPVDEEGNRVDNYVPTYHGCGVICRALGNAIAAGYVIDETVFSQHINWAY